MFPITLSKKDSETTTNLKNELLLLCDVFNFLIKAQS